MNRVRWIALACAMAAMACSGESLTVGENDASRVLGADVGADNGPADNGATDTGPADTGPADTGPADTSAPDTGAVETDAATVSFPDASPTDAGMADATPADATPADATPADAGVDVRVPPTSGSLVVHVAGNPSNARVVVTGPSAFTRTLDATATLDGLAFGSYPVAAPPTVLNGLSYNALVVGSPAQVTADAQAVVTVTFTATNTPPTIGTIAAQTLWASALTPTLVPFTVGDVEDGPTALRPTVTSSQPATVTAQVVASGTGWILSLLPGSAAGSAVVTISVTDSQHTLSTLDVNVAVSAAGIVTTNADSGPGSLRAVVAAVPAGATVTFAPTVVDAISLTSSIGVSRSIIIQGPGAGTLAIDGGDRVQMFYVTVPLTVSGLTFRHGYSGSYGGAIQAPGASAALTVRDCAFASNSSDMLGGAIYAVSNLTLSRSTFTSNSASSGGAVLAQGPLNTITGCTFRANTASGYYGGAVQAYVAQRTNLADCAFIANVSRYEGGAVALSGVGNSMGITNCTFSGNSAPSGGSAIVLNGAALSMSFTTVTASSGSPALHIINGAYSLKNSIVAGNNRGDFTALGHYESGDYNLLGSVTGASFSGMTNDRIGVAVALDPVASYGGLTPTVRLPSTSIAVDAIPAGACTSDTGPLATDQRGEARPAGARCDIGAFERQSSD